AAACERLAAASGRLDALVNCAGIGSFAPVESTDPEEWRRILDINLTGTFLACRAALPWMLDREGPPVVNVISIAGKMAFPNSGAYCASKWGALGFTRVLAAEVRNRGVRVTALCPGSVATPFWDRVEHSLDVSRMLKPERVAGAIWTILSQPPDVAIDEL